MTVNYLTVTNTLQLMSRLLVASDLHFEETEEQLRERRLNQLGELSEQVDYALVPGDVGEEKDWEELERTLEQNEVDHSATMGNMDTREDQHYVVDRDTVTDLDEEDDRKHTESGVLTDDTSKFVENILLMEDEFSGKDYDWLISHNPKHIGIDPWEQEFIPDEENSRGRATADHEFYDIVLTAHYHKGGAYVNENGSLVVTNPAVKENYKYNTPDGTVHLMDFQDDYVNVQEVKLDSVHGENVEGKKTIYEKTFRYDGEDFEEVKPEQYLKE